MGMDRLLQCCQSIIFCKNIARQGYTVPNILRLWSHQPPLLAIWIWTDRMGLMTSGAPVMVHSCSRGIHLHSHSFISKTCLFCKTLLGMLWILKNVFFEWWWLCIPWDWWWQFVSFERTVMMLYLEGIWHSWPVLKADGVSVVRFQIRFW